MNGGVSSEGLDSVQSWFRDPERVKQIESEVKAYEDCVQVIALALAKQENCPRPRPEATPRRKKSTNSIPKPQTKIPADEMQSFASQLEAHVGA